MLPGFQLVDVTVHTSLLCYQGSRLEQVAPLDSKGKVVRQKACSRNVSSSGSLHQQSPTIQASSHLAPHQSSWKGRPPDPKESSPSSEPSTATCSTHRAQACVVSTASPLLGIGRHQSHTRENTSPGAIYNAHNLMGVAAPLHI